MAFLFATTPPAIVILLQDTLVPYLAKLSPALILKILAFLLLTTTALSAYLLLQRPWLKWDELTGTWFNRFTGTRFCTQCKTNKNIVPLKKDNTTWRCTACGRRYYSEAESEGDTPSSSNGVQYNF
jgi:rubredoxin